MSKKSAVIILGVLFVISLLGSVAFFSFSKTGANWAISSYQTPGSTTTTTQNGTISGEPQEPKTEECPLNGEMLGKSLKATWEKHRPLGVMVENHLEARPQSGISSADVVYEAVAEGGITRFLLLFYCHDAPFVGPVRSARVHFMNMLREYGNYPLYAHVGGANCDESTGSGCSNGAKADALGIINDLGWGGYNDLNQFSVPFPVFWRDYDRLPDRATEHTVYSSTTKLWDYAKAKRELTNVDDKGVSWDKGFEPWKFKDEAAVGDRGALKKVDFSFWSSFASDYAVSWVYDKANNVFGRLNGGKPHVDKNTGKQLTAKNIVIVFADESPANDGYPGGHIIYDLAGSGDGLVFQDGKAIKGTWKKADSDSRLKMYDESGKEISFVRGEIFVEILPTGNKVTY